MNKKIIACNINEELVVRNGDLSIQSYDSPSGKEEYYVESLGINFQTFYKDAELIYEDLHESPGGEGFVFSEIKLNDSYFGNSTFQKKYLGKEFLINVGDKTYKGEFKEGVINLTLKI